MDGGGSVKFGRVFDFPILPWKLTAVHDMGRMIIVALKETIDGI